MSRLVQVFQIPTDVDYVSGFQELSRVNLQLRRLGASVPLLIHKARLERGVGNHPSSLDALMQAQGMSPDHPEILYELGVTQFCLAMAEAGALPANPRPAQSTTRSVRDLLTASLEAFTAVLERNPDDPEAARDLAVIAELLAAAEDDLQLADALRDGA